jgi:hypothetical protein
MHATCSDVLRRRGSVPFASGTRPAIRTQGGNMMEHDEMFEVLDVEEPTVVAMSMSMSFVAVDEDADDK